MRAVTLTRPRGRRLPDEEKRATFVRLTEIHVVLKVGSREARFHRTTGQGVGSTWKAWRLAWAAWSRWYAEAPERDMGEAHG